MDGLELDVCQCRFYQDWSFFIVKEEFKVVQTFYRVFRRRGHEGGITGAGAAYPVGTLRAI